MSKKKKIIISFLSFAFVALLSCGIAFLPNWNPKPTTPPSDIGQEEGVFETEAATTPTNTSGTWIDSGRRGTSFGGGSGTESDPYLISNAQQLAYLAYMVNAGNTYSGKYFEQTANIDLSAYYWVPIGRSKSYPFSGNYTANPFGVITNLYIKSDYAGLFGCVENATISNIGISSGYIEGESFAGGLVGWIYAGITTITNCHNTGDVSGTDDYSNTGGLVGRASDGTTITQCYNTGDVSGAGYSSPGGLVGLAYDITITQCYNTGNVTRSSAYSYKDSVGGLVGDAIGAVTITDSYNTGDVSSDADYAGGLVAQAGDYLTIINSYNTGVITNTSTNTSFTGSCAGGLVGDAGNYLTIINSYNTGVITSTSSNSTNTARSCAGGLVGGLV